MNGYYPASTRAVFYAEYDSADLSFHDDAAEFDIETEYDEGSFDADGRRASGAGWVVSRCELVAMSVGYRRMSRDELVSLIGPGGVAQLEADALDHVSDNITDFLEWAA